MNLPRLAPLVAALLIVQLAQACTTWDKGEELLPNRKVKVVVFPVRWLKLTDVICNQEQEIMELSGSLRNVSPTPLANVRIQADVFLAGEEAKQRFIIPLSPSRLLPSQSVDFVLSGTVDRPIAHVELHGFWDDSS